MSLIELVSPYANKNFCTNPSFEKGTAGWTLDSASIDCTRVSGKGFRGKYSIECTAAGSMSAGEDCLVYAISNLPASGLYRLSAFLYTTGALTGTEFVQINANGFSGANITVDVQGDVNTMFYAGRYLRLQTTLDLDADYTGNLVIKAKISGKSFWIDCVQIEDSYYTTYIDGDEKDCFWDAADHASTSQRPVSTRSGGRIQDLTEDLNVYLDNISGIGSPHYQVNTFSPANANGEVFENRKVLMRSMDLGVSIEGTDLYQLHQRRRTFWEVIKPWPAQEEQPFIIRYKGSSRTNVYPEILVHYDSGMEFDQTPNQGLTSRIPLRLVAPEPYWYQQNEIAEEVTKSRSITLYYMAARIQGLWQNLSASSFNGTVQDIIVDHINGYIYVCGEFTAPYSRIARYNLATSTWSGLGTGANGNAYALALDASGNLIVGGAFTTLNGVTVNGIGKWNGTTFTAYGTGVAGGAASVYDILIVRNGNIYICGNFSSADGNDDCNSIAYWDGSDFFPLSTGLGTGSVPVWSMAEDPAGNIYIGGEFLNVGDANGDYIIKWTGTAWQSLSTGLIGPCYSIDYGSNGLLYIAGDFDTAGGTTVYNICTWNGVSFSPMGSGFSGSAVVQFVKYISPNNIIAGGTFTTPARLAIWNGAGWMPADLIAPSTPDIRAIFADRNGDYYLGFSTTGSSTTAAQTTIVIKGTEANYPKLKVENNNTSDNAFVKYLENFSTGDRIWFNNYPIKPGESIMFDFQPNEFSVTSSLFGLLSNLVADGSDANFFLNTGSQGNIVDALITCDVPTNVFATIIYRPCHATVDGTAE